MENVTVSGYCKCCAGEIEAVRRLNGEAIEPAATIIGRTLEDRETMAENMIVVLVMADGSAAIRFSDETVIVAPDEVVLAAISGGAAAIDRVVFSDSAPAEKRELVETLLAE
jgi:hypothetical protein